MRSQIQLPSLSAGIGKSAELIEMNSTLHLVSSLKRNVTTVQILELREKFDQNGLIIKSLVDTLVITFSSHSRKEICVSLFPFLSALHESIVVNRKVLDVIMSFQRDWARVEVFDIGSICKLQLVRVEDIRVEFKIEHVQTQIKKLQSLSRIAQTVENHLHF